MSDFALVRGRRLRVTKVDGCGRVVYGSKSQVVTGGFITVAFAPNNSTVDPITVTNASGETCVSEPGSSKFANYGVSATFCKVQPEMFAMMTGMPVVMDAAGANAIGLRVNSQIDLDLSGFAMEVWSKVPQALCGSSGDPEYGYALAPFIKEGVLGGLTFENAAVSFTLENATTQDGNDWGAGPYDVEKDASDVSGPLNEAMDPYDHLKLIKTTVAPPSDTTGAAPLVAPGP